jgi:hypothetical protein
MFQTPIHRRTEYFEIERDGTLRETQNKSESLHRKKRKEKKRARGANESEYCALKMT